MKKCPFCHAEIEDNARFCLYCMKPLEEKKTVGQSSEKKPLWIYALVVFLLVAMACVCVWLFTRCSTPAFTEDSTSSEIADSNELSESNENTNKPDSNEDISKETSSPEQSEPADSQEVTEEDTKKTSTENNPPKNTERPSTDDVSTSGENTTAKQTERTPDTTKSTTKVENTTNQTTNQTTKQTTEQTTEQTTVTTESTQQTEPPSDSEKYSYVTATTQNTYPSGYGVTLSPVDAIVITKVNYVEPSGHYKIPERIDGKKVAAIMPYAFSASSVCKTVLSVTLPSTVKSIWNNAFSGCTNLSHIYLYSSVVEIYTDSFPPVTSRQNKLIIHCKSDCRNFNFYYYRNIANQFDADYAEWNG